MNLLPFLLLLLGVVFATHLKVSPDSSSLMPSIYTASASVCIEQWALHALQEKLRTIYNYSPTYSTVQLSDFRCVSLFYWVFTFTLRVWNFGSRTG